MFRLGCWVICTAILAVAAYFLAPLINEYVGVPFADWFTNLIFGPLPQ